jgi:hypothetical protein
MAFFSINNMSIAFGRLVYNIGFGALGRDTELVNAVKAFRTDPRNRELRDAAGFEIVRPFNLSRRCREALVFVSGDYGDLSTLQLWEAGKSPKNTPPDPPTVVPMPTFLKARWPLSSPNCCGLHVRIPSGTWRFGASKLGPLHWTPNRGAHWHYLI